MSKGIEAEEMSRRVPTSMNVDRDLWDELKILAIREKTTATDLLEVAIRDLLARRSHNNNNNNNNNKE